MCKENFSALSKTLPATTRFPNSRLPCVLYCNRSTFLPFARQLLLHATSSNYSSPNCKTSLGRNSADYQNGYSRSAMNSITSSQNERTLADQTELRFASSPPDFEWAWRAVKGQDERQKTAPLTALHAPGHSIVDVGEKNMEGRHVGLDFYDLLIEASSPLDFEWAWRAVKGQD